MSDLTPPTPNIPLLRKAVEWAEAEAAKTDGTCMWNQTDYVAEVDCGTAYCIAGYALAIQPTTVLQAYTVVVDGVESSYNQAARELLGLSDDEAYLLFYDWNSIADVRAVAEEIAARVGERL